DTVTLVRKDKEAWTVEPGDHPGDTTEVRSYLSSLRSTRAVDFPDDHPQDLGKYGLAAPRLTVTVATGTDGAASQALLVGGASTAPRLAERRDLRGADIAAEPAKDLAAWGLDHPDLRITLTDKEGQPIGTVLAAKHDGKPYVTRAGSETVFEARDYMYARLDKPPKDLVEEQGAAAEAAKATTTTEPSVPPEPGETDDGEDVDDGAD